MKDYVLIKVNDNMLILNYKEITKEEESIVNKNINKDDYFYCSLKYFKKHINTMIKKFNVDTLRIDNLYIFDYSLNIIDKLNIKTLILNFNSSICLTDYESLLNCKTIKNIYCYYMPKEYIIKFNDKGIEVDLRFHNKISNKFLELQNVKDVDELYYKKFISLSEEYNELIDDVKEFLTINYKLKGIHMYIYSKNVIDSIVDLVKNDESRNVVVFLHQEYDKGNFITNNFAWLKDLSDKCRKEYTCEFRIVYSHSFVKNNLFKQLTFNNLKLICIMCFYVSVVVLVIYESYQYIEKMSVASLSNELLESESNNEEENDIGEEIVTEEEVEETDKYKLDNSFNKLKEINKDTVGYLIVKSTDISYPVVQYTDNNYYLNHDFYKKKYSTGWIYLDYRNDINVLNDNSIIYGHNMNNGTMFGTLKNVLNSSYRSNEDNMIITLDTEIYSYKFRIFSTYKIDYTTDYLVTNFDNETDKISFINMIKERSNYDYNVNVGKEDKILTLSTCSGNNNKRLVVHAVLIKE